MNLPNKISLPARATTRTILFLGAALLATPGLAEPVTINSCNRQITFDEPPRRAVSNDVNITEMMLVLGLQDNMAGYSGVSGWRTLDEEIRADIAELPELATRYATKEVLIGADADFYFAGWNYGLKAGGELTPQTLAPFGIEVYELTESCIHIMDKPPASVDDMYNDLLNLGKIFHVTERAEKLVADYKAELEDFLANLQTGASPLRVFVYDSGEDAPFTAGLYAMPNALIEAAGGINIMNDLEKSWASIGWEPVIERNPQVIVIINYEGVTAEEKRRFLLENPAFSDIDAIKNDRFVVLQYNEATPGPRNIRAIKTLAEAFWGQ